MSITATQETPFYGHSLPLDFFERLCSEAFGKDFTPEKLASNVARTNMEYGGFRPNVTNVVFVHGSLDPWHAMGVLKDLNKFAPAIYIQGTAHCDDMYSDNPNDSAELTAARLRIGRIVKSWICQEISSVCR